ncbi:hypothetical protein C789_2517 [Microcystis aeruginosa FACHB-905 = DIANCHI905]|uniref:Uncharacterized protein n=1 Tax=Microcystis aeruginosa PCC 7806SL TaxID=1903187 RepID=A0AB33BV64_MICA7|nr:hypothetical protein BH695_1230 [Microcystis aeruginosa PCC 7806SL]ELS47706.1 hypothetical protein C789_2517 [Microcystis aeruginosa FACHB-905 = DIANCHI905]
MVTKSGKGQWLRKGSMICPNRITIDKLLDENPRLTGRMIDSNH